MSSDEVTVAGPRRYRVSFNCRTDAVGPVIGLLIKEVEQPKMETVGENYKLTLVCFQDQLVTVLGVVVDQADDIVVAKYTPETKMAPAVFRPPQQLARVVTPLQREMAPVKVRPVITRSPAGSNTRARDLRTGKAVLRAFSDGAVLKHGADFAEELVKEGYNSNSWSPIVARLADEGDLVRVGRGAYRLPTAHDQSFSSSKDDE